MPAAEAGACPPPQPEQEEQEEQAGQAFPFSGVVSHIEAEDMDEFARERTRAEERRLVREEEEEARLPARLRLLREIASREVRRSQHEAVAEAAKATAEAALGVLRM